MNNLGGIDVSSYGADTAAGSARRLDKVRETVRNLNLEAIWITGAANRRYVSGFTGTAGSLLITGGEALLITDSRYTEQAAAEAPAFRIILHGPDFFETMRTELGRLGITRIGFEAEHETVAGLEKAVESLPGVELVPTRGVVEALRLVKEPGEVDAIRKAAALTDEAFAALMPHIKAGAAERDLALELEYFMKRRGASDVSFPPIVVSGPRSALPHGRPTDRTLQPGDFVTFDLGCIWDGYASDMTRTVVIGDATARHEEIYHTVLKAQVAALEALKPGPRGRDIDAVARDIIAAAGYGDYFGHGLGHGVGLNVHEGPRLSPTGEDRLEPGMMVTVEPGIYVPGFGGVRIEDLVLITEDGCEILSATTKELLTF